MDPSERKGEGGEERRRGWKYVATRFPNFRTFQKRRGFMGVPRSNEIPLGRVCVRGEGEGWEGEVVRCKGIPRVDG